MNQKERLIEILKLLESKEHLKQDEIAEYFQVSKDTTRRDVLKLVEENLVERTKGGIQLPLIKQQITDYKNRIIQNSTEKTALAQVAQQLIKPNQTIWLDVSTTVELMGNDNLPKENLMITNSVDNAITFSKHINQLYLLGGYYQADSHLLKGPMLMTQLTSFYFDIAFIGASGISDEGVFFDELEDIHLHQQLKKQAKQVVLLVDSSKINKQTSFMISWENIDNLITGKELPPQLTTALNEHHIQTTIV